MSTLNWLERPSHHEWLAEHARHLLDFGRHTAVVDGGAAWLDDTGTPDLARGVPTWITARTVHVYSLGTLLGVPGCSPVAAGALAGLTGRLHDPTYGGWSPGLLADGIPASDKACYDHAFVVLAASSAVRAGLPGAEPLLEDATSVFLERFWDDAAGRCVDSWDTTFTSLDDYRGINGNMHAVEAMLAAADVTGDLAWLERAGRVCDFVASTAERHAWRIPEHYDQDWRPLLDYHDDKRDDPFKPYGATVGHGLEWARLMLHLEAAQGGSDRVDAAAALFERAVADGWAVDGASGFVYTTDWDGRPVVRDRMHWVVAEAIGAAAALWRRTGDATYARWYATWWDYVAESVLDRTHGSWLHQLDEQNRPNGTVWPGKPDLYHAFQATLIPRLPLAPTLATALAAGLLV